MSQGNRFGSLSAGMIVRGTVPPQVLFGPGSAVRAAPPPPASAPLATAPDVVAAEPPAKPAAAAVGMARKSVTFRVDPAQHLRLRVACAVQDRSAQAVLVEALTGYLDGLACCETVCR